MPLSIEVFEKKINNVIETNQIPGVGVGLNEKGKRLYHKGFGFRNVAKKLSVHSDTVFGIASMTKSFTCMAIMKLQDEGKLSVHDQVVKYLPEFSIPNKAYQDRVTIHHLMTHTTGIPPLATHKFARKRSVDQDPSAKDYGLDLVSDDRDPIDTYEELINYIANEDFSLLGPPGTQFSYSNDCYGLLGIIIARVSGQSYESFVEENILKPAQMNNSFFDLDELTWRDNVTTLYAAKEAGDEKIVYDAPMWWDAPSMRAAGYLKSTVNDILNYLEIFRNDGIVHSERILSEESVKQMIYPHVKVETGRYYGYGFSIRPNYFGSTLIEHGGGLKGVSSSMSIIPEKDVTGVVLTNLSSVPASKILLGANNLILGEDFSALSNQYQEELISPEKLTMYTGMFTSEEGMKVKLFTKDGHLILDDHDSTREVRLRFVGENTFITPDQREIRFIKGEDDQVVRIFYSSRQIFKD